MKVLIEVDLRGALGPVRDQGNRPTCLSHASSLAHEKSRNAAIPLSPEYLHHFASGGLPRGCGFQEVAGALKNHGQSTEEDCPYSELAPGRGWRPPHGVKVFRRASNSGGLAMAGVERVIQGGNIPVLGIGLPDQFFRPAAPWVIPAGNPPKALHAVAGVGVGTYRKVKTILIRNSWGTDWGDAGHAWLDANFIGRYLQEVLVLTHEVA